MYAAHAKGSTGGAQAAGWATRCCAEPASYLTHPSTPGAVARTTPHEETTIFLWSMEAVAYVAGVGLVGATPGCYSSASERRQRLVRWLFE